MSNRARMAEKLSIEQLQQSIQDGVLPSYIGVPLLKSKVEDAKLLQAAKAAQAMSQQPSVAQQIMSQAQQVGQPAPQMQQAEQGVPSLQSNLPASMAGGGIVAFAGGGMYDEDDTDEDRQDAERQAEMEEMMDEYAQTFQQGIGQLPAAQPQGREAPAQSQGIEGITSGDTSAFIDRIMQKESRGQRYGKDGKLLTSPKGAQGEMQVMPGTSRDPGYGVTPARDGSPDELARVGRDYANTLLERYGDPKLAAIAYNMGPGATDKWLAAGADPSKLPKETQGYVKGFAGGGEVQRFAAGDLIEAADLASKRATGFGLSEEQKENLRRKNEEDVAARAAGAAAGKSGLPFDPSSYNVKRDKKVEAAPKVEPKVGPPATEMDPSLLSGIDIGGPGSSPANMGAPVSLEPSMDVAAPAKPDRYAKYEEMFAKREDNLAKQREQDKYMAMLQAGLGMMGGTSQHALANIGAGGAQGIQSLAQSNAARTAEENALLSGRLGLEKIGATRDYQDAVIAYREDLAKKADVRARDLAGATLDEKKESRMLREKKEYGDQLESMRKDATTRMLANMKGQIIPGQESVIEAKALEALKSDPDYIELFQKVYGRKPSGGKISGGYGEPPAGAVKKI
jgi:soluble lytic murein transglycosylase-like protein